MFRYYFCSYNAEGFYMQGGVVTTQGGFYI